MFVHRTVVDTGFEVPEVLSGERHLRIVAKLSLRIVEIKGTFPHELVYSADGEINASLLDLFPGYQMGHKKAAVHALEYFPSS